MDQFLTAIFELHPPPRTAATLERARAANEEAFWDALAGAKAQAEAIIAMPRKKRRSAVREACKHIRKVGAKHSLTEEASRDLQRDIEAAVSSYIERKAGGHAATWPERSAGDGPEIESVLDQLASAIVAEDENAASVALALASRAPANRGLAFSRLQDARIVKDSAGGIAVRLNCVATGATRSGLADMRGGIKTAGVKPPGQTKPKSKKSKPNVVVPVSCSESDRNAFLNGAIRPRFSLVFSHADKWFIAFKFEMPETTAAPTGERPGTDRQIAMPVASDVEDKQGVSGDLQVPARHEVGKSVHGSGEHDGSSGSTNTFEGGRRQSRAVLAAYTVAPGALLNVWALVATVSGSAVGAIFGLILAIVVATFVAGCTYAVVNTVRKEIRTKVAVILGVSVNLVYIALLVISWSLFMNSVANSGAD